MYQQSSKREPTFGEIFRTLLKIFGALFMIGLLGFCLTSVIALIFFGGSLAALLSWIGFAFNNQPSEVHYFQATNPPAQVYQSNSIPRGDTNSSPELVISNPTPQSILPNSTPIIYWRWQAISLYGYKVELPNDWSLEENKFPNSENGCGLGHDLANYKLTDSQGNKIVMQFLCAGRDYDGDNTCLPDTIILDEKRGIARTKISTNEYHYGNYKKTNDNHMYCADGWEIDYQKDGGTVNEIADFEHISGNIDLQIIDRIVMSVQPFQGYISPTPTP